MKSIRLAMMAMAYLSAVSAHAHDIRPAPEALDRDALFEAFGIETGQAEVTAESLAPDLHVLFGIGGNMVASIGENGVLLVDDQIPELFPKISNTIKGLGGDKIDFVINTHFHFDHADGNLTLGPEGAWIVSHSSARKAMQEERLIDLVRLAYLQQPYPQDALPVMTYDESMQFHFNGQQIDLIHAGPAHTDGDTAVIFRGSNVVHMGDVFNRAGYPFVDAGNGGTLDGLVRFCERILAEIGPDAVVVPGHGPVGTRADLVAYTDMLRTIHERLSTAIAAGLSFEQIKAAGITEEWDEQMGDPSGLLDRAYWSLTHRTP